VRRDSGSGSLTEDERRRRFLLYAIAISGFVALAVVLGLFYLLNRGGGSGGTPSALAKTFGRCGGTLKTYPSEGRGHVSSLKAKIKYKTFPPTSGKHYFSPAIFDQYDTPVNELQLVHNLEHGAIVIQYGSGVSQATIAKISAFYRSDPNALVVAPLAKLGGKIALTAWTHLGTCTRFSEPAFTGFRKAYRYHGPERFPPSALAPGS
jgi:hypothetical protein